METIVSSIINELKLDDDQITNIYNFGSWVYGTDHVNSDRDFLIVMKTKNGDQSKRLKFQKDFDYFHLFELHRLKKCDVTIHSCENFELLLEKNYMLAVECLFYPDEFILRNNIDYKTIYLSKYYNPLRLKQVTFYENTDSFQCIIDDDDDEYDSSYSEPESNVIPTLDQFLCDAVHTTTVDEDRSLKYLFHGLRFLDIGEQLIRTKSIYDFKRISHVLFEMKDIYLNNDKNTDLVIDYVKEKSDEYKRIMNELVPTNIIHGTFQVHITVDNPNMETFLNVCQINSLKPICIHFSNGNKPEQLMASSYHVGTYPDIMEEIKTLTDTQFKDFNIIRLKIKSVASNHGVPENDIDKLLFWNKESNYFEFHYKIFVNSVLKLRRLKELCQYQNVYLAQNTFTETSTNDMYYIATLRLFDVGRINAFISNDEVIQCFTNNYFPPFKVKEEFVVYDSDIDLDSRCIYATSNSTRTVSCVTRTGTRYVIGGKNRKVSRRSTD